MGSTYLITCVTRGQRCCEVAEERLQLKEVLKLIFRLISMEIKQEVNVTENKKSGVHIDRQTSRHIDRYCKWINRKIEKYM